MVTLRFRFPSLSRSGKLAGFFLLLAVFSLWLMWHTFGYDSVRGELLISAKVYSDFGSHLPLIRSFSLGANWPPQHPLYPGEPIRYHYLFYMFAGLLEKAGFRPDFALNLPSAAGFFVLCLLIFLFARRLFASGSVAVLSVLFFLFNGSFSFLDFLAAHPVSPALFRQLFTLSAYPSFAPYNSSLISAFWNLNIYTNQRHLGLSFAVCLLLVLRLFTCRRRYDWLTGLLLGSLLLLNQAAFLVALIFIASAVLLSPGYLFSLPGLLPGFLPWLWLYFSTIGLAGVRPEFHPGFLLPPGYSLWYLPVYWLKNLGLHLILIPLGLWLAPPPARRLALPLVLLFVLPNLIRFSPDVINNHKFFNFFLLIGQMFSAGLLVNVWRLPVLRPLVVILVLLLCLGGIVDFFPLKNDYFLRFPDVSVNRSAAFFAGHTPPNSVVLNDFWFYHPASLAGRRLFNGYPYFTWSYGYNQISREAATRQIYDSPSAAAACTLLLRWGIDYVQVSSRPEGFLATADRSWLGSFAPEYTDPGGGFTVYSVTRNCRSL